jgi:uncharacterized heparinase superfamily protein
VISQYWETVRHLRPEQVLARVKLRTAAAARRSLPGTTTALYRRRVEQAGLRLRPALLGFDRAALFDAAARTSTARVDDITSGIFEFVGARARLGWPPDWSAPEQSRLWRFHLHYFDDAVEMALAGRTRELFALIDDWIRDNPVHGAGRTQDAWHPYTVSLRMVNWMVALSAAGGAADVPAHVADTLRHHGVFLERNLERDGGGNHLLKNLKALAVAGCFFQGETADYWRAAFGRRFAGELSRQLLADGGHYERSPMYHSQVLGDALEVAAILGEGHPATTDLCQAIARMNRFLQTVTHPDGEIALFNDSAHGMAPSPADLHGAVARTAGDRQAATSARLALIVGHDRLKRPIAGEPSAIVPEVQASASGYVVLGSVDRSDCLIADVGAVCPDDLPAHGHADMLSFEASVAGRRMLVNSGVGTYAAGAYRDYYRSTRAHNTVQLDSAEQSDCWGSFRVGRRAQPVSVLYDDGGGLTALSAEHTGYDARGVRHRRSFICHPAGFWVIADTLRGSGEHSWASHYHLHPEVEVTDLGDHAVRLQRATSVLDLFWYGPVSLRRLRGEAQPLQGWYAERFGTPVPADVLVFEGTASVPIGFGCVLVPRGGRDASATRVTNRPCGCLAIGIGDTTYTVDSVSKPGPCVSCT